MIPRPAMPVAAILILLARRMSADIGAHRAETFKAPKRSGTEPHITINDLFSTSSRRPIKDDAGFLKLKKPHNGRNTKRSSDTTDSEGTTASEWDEGAKSKTSRKKRLPAIKAVGHNPNDHAKYTAEQADREA
ncbi:hypothetical protein BU23DRAFT_228832 [Bimuria novae-zelandiae CBS 107.79]|uniref:Secreted protein n=1 Tax=Bimuria novae-zelandiae CBS 107.79 TaxID=1447943 RepID=A0A6A5VUR1_9PLEO|nr:hypothetical protein BU23DRAFT_228832 [Bimuria novae-zelandiae CBS 107.79]